MCTVEPTKIGCGTAIGAYLTSIDNQSETSYECKRGYEQAKYALKVCQDESNEEGNEPGTGDGSTGGGGVGGSGSGSSGNSGGICTKKTYHSVCTGGGCTTWSEITITSC